MNTMPRAKTDFWKYISLSVLGMLGSSGTILADTFFVSARLGTDGLAALNIAISVFGLINGFGMLLGIGGATRYTIAKVQRDDQKGNELFSLALLCAAVLGLCFFITGLLFASPLACALGADASLAPLCSVYLRTVLLFAPFFILNHLFLAFIRNDGNPRLSMAMMAVGSCANIVLDYLFLYPLHMGIFGAALATGLAPVISLAIASLHFLGRKNHFRFVAAAGRKATMGEVKKLAAPGLSACINEMSSCVVLVIFNLLILRAAGNTGVAAYGIVANLALVVLAVFTGIAQGLQPLLSRAYGRGDLQEVEALFRRGRHLAFLAGSIVLGTAVLFSHDLVVLFNSEHDAQLQALAEEGMRLYFIGFLAVGYNYLSAAVFSVAERSGAAFGLSFFRGCIGIAAAACLFSSLWGMVGIWLTFPAVEGVTALAAAALHRANSPAGRKLHLLWRAGGGKNGGGVFRKGKQQIANS